jgi:hypothetical protein
MDHNQNKEGRNDQFLRDQVKQAGLMEPSQSFVYGVLDRIEAEETQSQPLMGAGGWVVFAAAVCLCIFGLYWISPEAIDWSGLSGGLSLNWQLNWSFGPSVIAGAVFALLFWVQLILLRQKYLLPKASRLMTG